MTCPQLSGAALLGSLVDSPNTKTSPAQTELVLVKFEDFEHFSDGGPSENIFACGLKAWRQANSPPNEDVLGAIHSPIRSNPLARFRREADEKVVCTRFSEWSGRRLRST